MVQLCALALSNPFRLNHRFSESHCGFHRCDFDRGKSQVGDRGQNGGKAQRFIGS